MDKQSSVSSHQQNTNSKMRNNNGNSGETTALTRPVSQKLSASSHQLYDIENMSLPITNSLHGRQDSGNEFQPNQIPRVKNLVLHYDSMRIVHQKRHRRRSSILDSDIFNNNVSTRKGSSSSIIETPEVPDGNPHAIGDKKEQENMKPEIRNQICEISNDEPRLRIKTLTSNQNVDNTQPRTPQLSVTRNEISASKGHVKSNDSLPSKDIKSSSLKKLASQPPQHSKTSEENAYKTHYTQSDNTSNTNTSQIDAQNNNDTEDQQPKSILKNKEPAFLSSPPNTGINMIAMKKSRHGSLRDKAPPRGEGQFKSIDEDESNDILFRSVSSRGKGLTSSRITWSGGGKLANISASAYELRTASLGRKSVRFESSVSCIADNNSTPIVGSFPVDA